VNLPPFKQLSVTRESGSATIAGELLVGDGDFTDNRTAGKRQRDADAAGLHARGGDGEQRQHPAPRSEQLAALPLRPESERDGGYLHQRRGRCGCGEATLTSSSGQARAGSRPSRRLAR